MIELIDLLSSNPDMLPSNAAEKISLQRLIGKEKQLTAKDIMESIPTIDVNSTAQDAAILLINDNSDIAAVLKEDRLIGVVTDWDITKAMAENACDVNLDVIMTQNVIIADPNYTIIDIVRDFEQFRISAMPVVENGKVLGKVNVDLIAQRYILHSLKES